MAVACIGTACWSDDKPPPLTRTGFIPDRVPPVAYEAVAREGDNARLFEVVPVTWPDGCLGVYNRGTLCTLSEVPGYRVLVERDGWLIEYRAGEHKDHLKRVGVRYDEQVYR